MYVILVYDMKQVDDYARAARNVFKTCKKFLTHVQNSVFEGSLSDSQLLNLKIQLKKHLRPSEDSCILFINNNENWLKKEFLTQEADKTTNIL